MTHPQASDTPLVEVTLKPCPFCGGEAVVQHGTSTFASVVGCGNAECRVRPEISTRRIPEAAAAWNTRLTECPSCHGLNTACPEGCGRDPETGELDGTRLAPQAPDRPTGELVRELSDIADDFADNGDLWKERRVRRAATYITTLEAKLARQQAAKPADEGSEYLEGYDTGKNVGMRLMAEQKPADEGLRELLREARDKNIAHGNLRDLVRDQKEIRPGTFAYAALIDLFNNIDAALSEQAR